MVNVGAASSRISQRPTATAGWFEPGVVFFTGATARYWTTELNRIKIDNGFYTYVARYKVTGDEPGGLAVIGFAADLGFVSNQYAGRVMAMGPTGTITDLPAFAVQDDVFGSCLKTLAPTGQLPAGATIHVNATWIL